MIVLDDITETVKLQEHLKYIESHDYETGLMNTETFKQRIADYSEKHECSLAGNNMYAISIGNYHQIKSKLNSKAHAAILRNIVEYISSVINKYSIFARISENEYCIFSNGTPLNMYTVKKLLSNSRSTTFDIDGMAISADFKLGLYKIRNIDVIADEAIDCASYALRVAEQDSHSHICIYNEQIEHQHRLSKHIVENLGKFDYHKEFELTFQPVIDIVSDKIASAEALIQWNHPRFGRITPDNFINVFENNGEIWHLGLFIVDRVCHQLSKWKNMLSDDFCMSLNVSKKQIERSELFENIMGIVNQYEIPSSMLEFEITETAAVNDIEIVKKFCSDASEYGFGVTLDDFGSGNTTLGFITEFNLKKIKFDTSLTDGIEIKKNKRVVTQSMLDMCNHLNLQIVVEHVETIQSLEQFRSQGFRLIQGFVFSPPLSPENFEQYYTDYQMNKQIST